MSNFWYTQTLREPIPRRYAMRINKGGFYVFNYFDSKREMLRDFMLHKKGTATPYILKQKKYILWEKENY